MVGKMASVLNEEVLVKSETINDKVSRGKSLKVGNKMFNFTFV